VHHPGAIEARSRGYGCGRLFRVRLPPVRDDSC
jgi:hypothetical protein